MLKLVLSDGIITCSKQPEKIYGTDVLGFTARVDFMGGSYKNLPNPSKLNGPAKDIEIECISDVAAQSYGAKMETGRQAGAFVKPDIRLVSITAAKLSK